MLKENSYQFRGSNYLKTSGTAMGTKKAIAFANPFKARIENQILSQSCIEPCHQRIFSRMWWEFHAENREYYMVAWREDNWPSMFRSKVKTFLNSAGTADD